MCGNSGITGFGIIPDRTRRGAVAVCSVFMEWQMERISVIILEREQNGVCRIPDEEFGNLCNCSRNIMWCNSLVVSFL